jgi:hypothetical protein
MEQLPTLARNLLVIAALAWLFCVSTALFHIIPLGFEATTVYVGLVYLFGASLTLIALTLTLISLFRYGRTKTRLTMCFWSIGMVLAFVALTLASFVIGSIAEDANHLTMRWSERLAALVPYAR